MPLFRRAKTPPTPPAPAASTPELPIDPAYGDPDATRLRAAMAAGDWPAARQILTADHDHDDFAFLIDTASRVPGSEQWLPDAVRGDLDDLLPSLLYGARAITWAWEARTGARAKYVNADQFAVFFDRLRLAEDCLQDVVRRDPDNTAAWTELITVARGLQLGQDEARRRFDQVIRVHPTHARAHRQLLQQLCKKWSGSHEAMFSFARQAHAAAPPGNKLGILIPEAHIEAWIDTHDSDYYKSASVLTEIQQAARRTVLHPDYHPGKGWPIAHNTFAMTLALANDHRTAAQLFQTLGDHVTEMPWAFHRLGSPRAYIIARTKALAVAGIQPPSQIHRT